MKRYTSLFVTGFSLLTLLASVFAPEANALVSRTAAATNQNVGQALEIAPPIMTLTANPGQVINTTIQLRDITSTNLVVTNEIDDFVAQGEDGTPKILTGDDSNNPFQLKQWITPLSQFTMTPQQIEKLPVSINVPKNASPGGHYGVIRFTGVPPQLKGTGVSLSASIGALVLLTVNGNLKHQLSVNQFAVGQNTGGANGTVKVSNLFQSTPLTFVVKLQNEGNIQEEPVGLIQVTDMFGKPLADVNINVPPRNVLPDSIRMFTGTLDKSNLGPKRLFGLYHAKLTAHYGAGNAQVVTSEIAFWVIPWKLILIIVILLIVAFFTIRYMLKRYRQRIIKQTTARSKKISNTPAKRRRM